MDADKSKLITSIKRATILSGIGMGLLLGIIMGLSTSEVVKTIFGVLTALLGAFLGFDRRSFAGMQSDEYEKEQYNTLYTALRAGWFGLGVVFAILLGMWIRTHEILNLSPKKAVERWTEAGFHPDYARKLVTYQKFAINPQSGELGAVTELQRAAQGALFSAADRKTLCGSIDPDNWNNDWPTAKKAMLELKIEGLNQLVGSIEANVPDELRFDFLRSLRILVCEMNDHITDLCSLGSDLDKWYQAPETSAIAGEIDKLGPTQQHAIMEVLSNMVCQIERE